MSAGGDSVRTSPFLDSKKSHHKQHGGLVFRRYFPRDTKNKRIILRKSVGGSQQPVPEIGGVPYWKARASLTNAWFAGTKPSRIFCDNIIQRRKDKVA
jgi:hypothetical protein